MIELRKLDSKDTAAILHSVVHGAGGGWDVVCSRKFHVSESAVRTYSSMPSKARRNSKPTSIDRSTCQSRQSLEVSQDVLECVGMGGT